MCIFMGNLAARSLSVIFRLWPKISNLLFSRNAPPYDGCQWGRYRSSCKFLLRWFRYSLSWFFLRSTSQYYTCQLFLSQMREASPCYDQDFRKCPGDFQRFPTTFQRLRNFAENVSRCSEDVWALFRSTEKMTIVKM